AQYALRTSRLHAVGNSEEPAHPRIQAVVGTKRDDCAPCPGMLGEALREPLHGFPSRRWEAVRIGRAVAAFQPHLVRAISGRELDAEFALELDAAAGLRLRH